jgi:hypothetical protein
MLLSLSAQGYAGDAAITPIVTTHPRRLSAPAPGRRFT